MSLHDPSHEVPICRDSFLSPRLTARLQHETATGGTGGSNPQSSAVDLNQESPNTEVAGAGVSGECSHDTLHEAAPCEVPRFVVKSFMERGRRRWLVFDSRVGAPVGGEYRHEGEACAKAEAFERAA